MLQPMQQLLVSMQQLLVPTLQLLVTMQQLLVLDANAAQQGEVAVAGLHLGPDLLHAVDELVPQVGNQRLQVTLVENGHHHSPAGVHAVCAAQARQSSGCAQRSSALLDVMRWV